MLTVINNDVKVYCAYTHICTLYIGVKCNNFDLLRNISRKNVYTLPSNGAAPIVNRLISNYYVLQR